MKYQLLSDLLAAPKYDVFNVNKKRKLVEISENTQVFKDYREIIKTDMLPVNKAKYYRSYLEMTEIIFDTHLENLRR